jgi:hypothetical protein
LVLDFIFIFIAIGLFIAIGVVCANALGENATSVLQATIRAKISFVIEVISPCPGLKPPRRDLLAAAIRLTPAVHEAGGAGVR